MVSPDCHLTMFDIHIRGGSSVGGASDRKVRCNTDAGSSPRGGKGLSPRVSLQCRLLRCPYSPRVQSHALRLCARQKSPTPAVMPLALCGHRKTLHTPIGIGSDALSYQVRRPKFPGRDSEVLIYIKNIKKTNLKQKQKLDVLPWTRRSQGQTDCRKKQPSQVACVTC